MFDLSPRDNERLVGVHPHLARVIRTAAQLSDIRFTVLEGVRSLERQRQLFAQGASQTMNSRHLTGHAVDIAPMVDGDGDGKLEVSWSWPLYDKLAQFVRRAAQAEQVPLEWGGDWKFRDGPHWQLPWGAYPSTKGA